MSNILQIGFASEGSTDNRFLVTLIQKTFESIALECKAEIEVYQPEILKKGGENFVDQVVGLVTKYPYFHVICIHADADSDSNNDRLRFNFKPAYEAVQILQGDICRNLVEIIPIHMTEAWMLADLDLLKRKIGTNMSNRILNLPESKPQIERIADPKRLISEALRIAQESRPRRRRRLSISDLYSPISQELELRKLMDLPSYVYFYEKARSAMIKLNYLE